MDKCGYIGYGTVCQNNIPCSEHSNLKCWKCGQPATRMCTNEGQFVCGMPECALHSHGAYHNQSDREYVATHRSEFTQESYDKWIAALDAGDERVRLRASGKVVLNG